MTTKISKRRSLFAVSVPQLASVAASRTARPTAWTSSSTSASSAVQSHSGSAGAIPTSASHATRSNAVVTTCPESHATSYQSARARVVR